MPSLVLGPLLRYAGERDATVWVETDAPCGVSVLGRGARTFTVHGRHYALVVVDGLEPGTATPYTVELDGRQVWPEPGGDMPASVIRTFAAASDAAHHGPDDAGTSRAPRRAAVAFGSCRLTMRVEDVKPRLHGVDALEALGQRGLRDPSTLPDLLFLAGDQVYADELVRAIQPLVHVDPDGDDRPRPPRGQVADFEEYARLYGIAWSAPAVRWLLSTVPSAMVFDDHDVCDDWNTSAAWREQMATVPWWSRRITAALGSYWVYQHLGNLAPDHLADDPLLAELTSYGGDAGDVLDEFARSADQDPESNRWSYVRDVGDARLVVVDTRAGRRLHPDRRVIADDVEWGWCAEQARRPVRHLLVGSSLPYLLPRPISDIESWDEAVASGVWGRRWVAVAERIRQGLDLEHWASFQRSFTDMSRLLRQVVTCATPPASVVVLSGDVHYSYLARAGFDDLPDAPVWQVVCSPIRNPLGSLLRFLNVVAFWRPMAGLGRWLVRRAGVAPPELSWEVEQGPWFDNAVAIVECEGDRSTVTWWRSVDQDGELGLRPLRRAALAR